jgi:16S rRNA (cytosine967-C5)-methyltransferase
VTSFLKIFAYNKYVENMPERDLRQNVRWARQILGWKELLPFEKQIALIASGTLDAYRPGLTEFELIALQSCNPVWFVQRAIRVFGRTFALKILARNLTLLPLYIRLNPLKIRDEARANDIAEQVRGIRLAQPENTLKMNRPPRALTRSESFKSGEIVVHDLASIVTGLVASPKRGAVVLELCAAPGNKTSHLAAIMENTGEICSIDVSEKRLSHWKTEMDRTGVTVAYPIIADARRIPTSKDADLVMVDPPCSNTGVFARNPSIKWKSSAAGVDQFAMKQRSILEAGSEHVRPNGTLVYCTCSILPEENELVIEDFLKIHRDFRLVPQTPFLGSPALRGLDLCQRFYPHIHDCNGYFIAKLQRMN